MGYTVCMDTGWTEREILKGDDGRVQNMSGLRQEVVGAISVREEHELRREAATK